MAEVHIGQLFSALLGKYNYEVEKILHTSHHGPFLILSVMALSFEWRCKQLAIRNWTEGACRQLGSHYIKLPQVAMCLC